MPACVERKPGHYWVKIEDARVQWHIARWTGEHFEMPCNPCPFPPLAFTKIGPRVEDQLLSVKAAMDAPHYGWNDTLIDNYFDACDPIRSFVEEADLK
ncbi:hypothetical protein MHM88_14550 [Epibacterium sp. MM17-32]|uniref:hypothetical protein n=1 Tax=Epibacterium sp. MM17-32 TaxID=2917734 RepID=UPI001EF4EA1C|nr:hypothetical protein [Epibacterium sp. MM17-32]MCG7629028.1 hypothetical protein [Epibacterium sp. MM17-32]